MSAQQSPTQVFLLAENRLLREALARILTKKSDMRVAGSCCFSPVAKEQVAMAQPDILVMDALAGTPEHVDLIRHALETIPAVKLIVIGMDADEQRFLASVRQGVLGYVLKEASAFEVVEAIRAVARGEGVCPAELSAALFRSVSRQATNVPNLQMKIGLGLTNREQQLVFLIGRGFTNKEIANELQLAEQTVRNHVHRMLRKVGVSDRLAAVELCRMQGLPI